MLRAGKRAGADPASRQGEARVARRGLPLVVRIGKERVWVAWAVFWAMQKRFEGCFWMFDDGGRDVDGLGCMMRCACVQPTSRSEVD